MLRTTWNRTSQEEGLAPAVTGNVFSTKSRAYSQGFPHDSEVVQYKLPGALHYVTGTVRYRIRVFQQDRCCAAFLEVLSVLLHDWPCKLIVFVIMPDHFHLIVNPRDGNIQGFTGALKSLTAKKIVEITGDKRFRLKEPDRDGSTYQVWQDSFKIHAVMERLDDLAEDQLRSC